MRFRCWLLGCDLSPSWPSCASADDVACRRCNGEPWFYTHSLFTRLRWGFAAFRWRLLRLRRRALYPAYHRCDRCRRSVWFSRGCCGIHQTFDTEIPF